MLRVAIVGCGKIADGHVEEIQKQDGARLVAVCDREYLMAEQLAVRHDIPKFYDDFEEMLSEESPHVVHVTTPPQSHLALAKRACESGCHVYVEKPLAMDHAQALELVRHVEENQRKMTVGYAYHFDQTTEKVRALVKSGTLGELVHLEVFFGYNLEGTFGSAILASDRHWVHDLPGKLFQNNIDHLLHKIPEFIPDEHPNVRATAFKRRHVRHGDRRDELLDELRVMIIGEGVTANCTLSSHARPVAHYAHIIGTRNTIYADYAACTVTVDQGITLPSAIGRLIPGFRQGNQFYKQAGGNVIRFLRSNFHYWAGMNRLIRLFYDSIRDDTPVPIPYTDMLRISAMQEEIYEQIGTRVHNNIR